MASTKEPADEPGGETRLPDRLTLARADLIENNIVGRGITNARVIDAMNSVRRERFVPRELIELAYEDTSLHIGSGQTISQPFIVAFMVEAAAIAPTDRVLEVGTGSGYGAAILSMLGAEVWTIERHRILAETAEQRLQTEGFRNVHVLIGDGTLGWPDEAPYDVIVVTAGGPAVPRSLCEQLVDGGRLVLPTGPDGIGQSLLRVLRQGDSYETEELGAVRFVPLIGAEGWMAGTEDTKVTKTAEVAKTAPSPGHYR